MVTDVNQVARFLLEWGVGLIAGGIVLYILGIVLERFPVLSCVFGAFRVVFTNWAVSIAGIGLILLVIYFGLSKLGAFGHP